MEKHYHAPHNHQTGNDIAYFCNEITQFLKLLAQRSLDRIVNSCSLENLAALSGISHGRNLHHAMPFQNFCAAHYMI